MAEEKLTDLLNKIYFNQNVIIWVLSYIGVAYASMHPGLCWLCCVSRIMYVVTSLSVLVTLFAYTRHYCAKKNTKKTPPASK